MKKNLLLLSSFFLFFTSNSFSMEKETHPTEKKKGWQLVNGAWQYRDIQELSYNQINIPPHKKLKLNMIDKTEAGSIDNDTKNDDPLINKKFNDRQAETIKNKLKNLVFLTNIKVYLSNPSEKYFIEQKEKHLKNIIENFDNYRNTLESCIPFVRSEKAGYEIIIKENIKEDSFDCDLIQRNPPITKGIKNIIKNAPTPILKSDKITIFFYASYSTNHKKFISWQEEINFYNKNERFNLSFFNNGNQKCWFDNNTNKKITTETK
jgi:hypothetical protein